MKLPPQIEHRKTDIIADYYMDENYILISFRNLESRIFWRNNKLHDWEMLPMAC